MKKLILSLVMVIVAITSFAQNKYAEMTFLTVEQVKSGEAIVEAMKQRILDKYGTIEVLDHCNDIWLSESEKRIFTFNRFYDGKGGVKSFEVSIADKKDYVACINKIGKHYGDIIMLETTEHRIELINSVSVTEQATFRKDGITVTIEITKKEGRKDKYLLICYQID